MRYHLFGVSVIPFPIIMIYNKSIWKLCKISFSQLKHSTQAKKSIEYLCALGQISSLQLLQTPIVQSLLDHELHWNRWIFFGPLFCLCMDASNKHYEASRLENRAMDLVSVALVMSMLMSKTLWKIRENHIFCMKLQFLLQNSIEFLDSMR